MWNDTEAARRLGIKHPIILGPFGGASSEKLVALVSELGGLGSYGANPLSGLHIKELAARLRRATQKPFAINLWVPTPDQPYREAPNFEAARDRLAPYFAELNLPLPPRPEHFGEYYGEQVEAMLEARPAVFSFVYGVPAPEILTECRRLEIVTLGTATTAEEAELLEKAGVDMVVATGSEAGGHRVSFLDRPEKVLTGLFGLVPQVVDRVKIPVIAAGGIADGRGVAAALTLGASGVQVGTAFLACDESAISSEYRHALFSAKAWDTCLTRAFTGRLARAVRNRFVEEMEEVGALAPYPVQSWLTSTIRSEARRQGRADLQNLWAGQATALLHHRSAAALFEALVSETASLMDRN